MSFRVTAEVFPVKCPNHPAASWHVKEWRFRIRARNGEIIAQSEGYKAKADAIDTARLLAPFVKVVEGS